ncbi:MAG: hypothetical protein CMM93_04395 [Rickettsiales bacterium]|nr:hypothetical protein [Rickettsiales bacterium]|tara:strand:+ start:524 stop:1225 length:702 start_codon:yes stop_codon:yes gene_type:complete
MEVIRDYCNKHLGELDPYDGLARVFLVACDNGHLDMVRYVLDYSDELPENSDIKINVKAHIEFGFMNACSNGHLDIVKFFLDYARLNSITININAGTGYSIESACSNGHLDVVQFLVDFMSKPQFRSPLIGEIDFHSSNDFSFRWACMNKHYDVIDFLLPILNAEKDKFYFYKKGQFYILHLHEDETETENEMLLPNTKFEHFRIYHKETDYLDDCVEAFKVNLCKSRKKSAY